MIGGSILTGRALFYISLSQMIKELNSIYVNWKQTSTSTGKGSRLEIMSEPEILVMAGCYYEIVSFHIFQST